MLIFIFSGTVCAQDLNQTDQIGMDDSHVLSDSNLDKTISSPADESGNEMNDDLTLARGMGNTN